MVCTKSRLPPVRTTEALDSWRRNNTDKQTNSDPWHRVLSVISCPRKRENYPVSILNVKDFNEGTRCLIFSLGYTTAAHSVSLSLPHSIRYSPVLRLTRTRQTHKLSPSTPEFERQKRLEIIFFTASHRPILEPIIFSAVEQW